jgi:hypothetical protein
MDGVFTITYEDEDEMDDENAKRYAIVEMPRRHR